MSVKECADAGRVPVCFLVAVVAFCGCETPAPPPPTGPYVDAYEPGVVNEGVGFYDYDLVVKKMTESLVRKLQPKDGSPPVITFGPLDNKTPFDIDRRQLMDDIQIEVLNAGTARFSAATDIEKAGGESGHLWQQLEFQSSSTGLVDPATAKQFGKVIGADYMLYGRVTYQKASGGGRTQHTYQLNMKLHDIETGLVVWADRKRIRKNFPTR